MPKMHCEFLTNDIKHYVNFETTRPKVAIQELEIATMSWFFSLTSVFLESQVSDAIIFQSIGIRLVSSTEILSSFHFQR